MTREEFLLLFEKQLHGTITPKENARLSAWFDQQQSEGFSVWEQEQLGNQKELEETIYTNIRQQDKKQGIFRLYHPWLSIAAAVLLVCAAALLWQKTKTLPHKTTTDLSTYTEVKSGYGQVLKIVLADRSIVWLNAGSRLRYPEKFNGPSRELYLEGEAFFDVKHQKSQPFIVHSGALRTQVLGTSFNIKAYKNAKQLKVSVASGKVGIYADKVNTIYLIPNQTGIYNKTIRQISRTTDQIKDVAAWREGKLVYHNELLSQALEDIANKYGVRITTSPNMSNCRIYGTFNHDNVETLLKMIAYSVNGKVLRKACGFHLSGKGCN